MSGEIVSGEIVSAWKVSEEEEGAGGQHSVDCVAGGQEGGKGAKELGVGCQRAG